MLRRPIQTTRFRTSAGVVQKGTSIGGGKSLNLTGRNSSLQVVHRLQVVDHRFIPEVVEFAKEKGNQSSSPSLILSTRIGRSLEGLRSPSSHGVLNMAPTGSLLFMTIEHVGAVSGTQFVDHPPKVDPSEGTAVSVTVVPKTKFPEQAAPPLVVQLMTPSALVTVPVPKPT